jgi:hypothetical protein
LSLRLDRLAHPPVVDARPAAPGAAASLPDESRGCPMLMLSASVSKKAPAWLTGPFTCSVSKRPLRRATAFHGSGDQERLVPTMSEHPPRSVGSAVSAA